MRMIVGALVFIFMAEAAGAAQQASVEVRSSAEYGRYLVDGNGRALYLFTADTRGTADRSAVSACQDACLSAWPPVIVETAPKADDGAQAAMVSTMERPDGRLQATYNGWPLYRWVSDEGKGFATGQDVKSFGGEWYLVTPSGQKAHAGTAPQGGERQDSAFAGLAFKSPECVRYDAKLDRYLVSNINGGMTKEDGNGFISLVTRDGARQLKWIEGGKNGVVLNAPKGMAIHQGTLYVADINHLRTFDAESGDPKDSVLFKDARFLNDLAIAEDGTVYVTDTGTKDVPGAIYRMTRDGEVRKLAEGRDLKRPNGISLNRNGELVVVTFDGQEVMTVATDGSIVERRKLKVGQLDGLEIAEDGTLYVSTWTDKAVVRLSADGSREEVVLTNAESPAAFELDSARNQLIVPLPRANQIVTAPLNQKEE